MIPTHGAVTSAFLLANAIRYEELPDFAAWVKAAQARSSFLAAAVRHEPIAQLLLDAGLASLTDKVRPSSRLRAVSAQADRPTLVALATLFLEAYPPPWIRLAVIDDEVRDEFIPSADRDGLAWLEPERDHVLLSMGQVRGQTDNVLALGVGRAAELVVMAALEAQGASPIHVAEISDRFGYDIECGSQAPFRWEVKGCTERTSHQFHLSRNEFDVSRRFHREWILVQVQFHGDALTSDELSSAAVKSICELSSSALSTLVPTDLNHFSWETSALITPPLSAWRPSKLQVPTQFRAPSLEALGQGLLASLNHRQPYG